MKPLDEHTLERIERYLLDKMSRPEKLAFEQELAASEDLAREVAFQRNVIEAVRLARKKEIKGNLRKNLSRQRRLSPLWISAAAVLVVVLGTALFFMTNKKLEYGHAPTADVQMKRAPAPDAPPAEAQDTPAGTDKLTAESNLKANANGNTHQWQADSMATAWAAEANVPAEAEKPKAEQKPLEIKAPASTSINTKDQGYSVSDNYSVDYKDLALASDSIKSDVLLKDTAYPVIAMIAMVKKSTDSDMAYEKVKTSRQPATPPVKNTRNDTGNYTQGDDDFEPVTPGNGNGTSLNVNFWQSPVNFKGYKYFRSDVDLYGISPKDKIQFIRWSGSLYMKQNKNLYRLTEQNDYSNFVPVKDQATLEAFGL